MTPEQIYHGLKELSEKLGVTVSEHNFRKTGIKIKSGLCKIKDEQFFIIANMVIKLKTDFMAAPPF